MTERRADKRGRRIAWGGVIVCLALALLVLMMWAARPRWRTYTFPPDPKTGMAVAIDYPEDWRIGTTLSPDTEFSSRMYVNFAPVPLTGLARWWMEKVLRQDIYYEENDDIQLSVASGPAYKDMVTVETEVRNETSSTQGFLQFTLLKKEWSHEVHTLGPILDASATAQFPGAANKQEYRLHGVIIFPQATAGAGKINISAVTWIASPRFPRFSATLTEMIPRIHLVKTPGLAR